MIDITIRIDETDLDLFAKVFTAAHLKLRTNGVAMSAEAHKRVILGRIFKNGLAQEEQRFLRDPVADARKLQAMFCKAEERVA